MDRPIRTRHLLRARLAGTRPLQVATSTATQDCAQSYPEELIAPIAELVPRYGLGKVGPRTYRMTATDARQIGYLLDAIEEVVLR